MDDEHTLTAADRVVRLLQHLGVARAHFAGGTEVAASRPDRVASLTLVAPTGTDAVALRSLAAGPPLARPPLVVHGEGGPLDKAAPQALAAYPGAVAAPLRGYPAALWSDVVADRVDEVGRALMAHLTEAERHAPLAPLRLAEGEGEVTGVTYRARGSGPPLLLFPLLLFPSQWEPLIPALAERYCTLTLGGPHIGVVAALEQRAAGGYGTVVDGLIDALHLPAGGTALEVGCATGALTRRLARRAGPGVRVIGADINAYFLREAATLARREGLGDRIEFRAGNAESLPFPDASFDAALACTVLDEVDTDRGLAELKRVVRPGGRVAVLVRTEDIPAWDSLSLSPALRAKLNARGGAGTSERACADATIYRRFRAAGFADAAMGPRYAVDRPEDGLPAWRAFFEGNVLGALDEVEAAEWRAAAERSMAEGSFLWAWSYHCAVGTRP